MMKFTILPIGTIHTPYNEEHTPPFQTIENDTGDFYVELFPEHINRVYKLDSFNYIYLIYWLDRVTKKPKQFVSPPKTNKKVGLFASRSPNRINPLGLSVVKIIKITDNRIIISGIDAFDSTPLIDIKPYIKDLDVKPDANSGWVEKKSQSKGHL